jgi:hypothetical protein
VERHVSFNIKNHHSQSFEHLSSEQNSTNNSTINLPVELVGLLKHAGVDRKTLTWDLQVNASAISVKLIWIWPRNPLQQLEKLPARPQRRNTSLLPPGNGTLNASANGRRKGTKPLVTLK